MATESRSTSMRCAETSGAEIPQSPRFAVQHLTKGAWQTLTFGTHGDETSADSPYRGRPLIYHSRYVAEGIAKAYGDMTVRVHELGAVDEERDAA